MPPVELVIGFIIVATIAVAGISAGLFLWAREMLDEQRHPVPAWDARATAQLTVWRLEQAKEKKVCPGCGGTRCWDWNREGRSCADNPTLAPGEDILSDGRHNKFTVNPVAESWWPIPRSRMARLNPHLWAKVADHAQIPVSLRPGLVTLP